MSQSGFRPSDEQSLVEALAICLDAMARGTSLETCLEMFPTLAGELRPLLTASQSAQSLYTAAVPADAMNRSRTRALARAMELRTHPKPLFGLFGWFNRLPRAMVSSMAVFAIFIASLFTLNAMSTSAIPGDTLYPMKRGLENLWLNVPLSPQQLENLESTYQQRRVEEVQQLLALGRVEEVVFEGILTKRENLSGIAPERWTVSDIFVLRMFETSVIGDIQLGMLIEVVGRTNAAGYVEAATISPKAFAFVGLVDEMTSSVWTVDGKTVFIQPSTQLDEGIGVGDSVMVLASFDAQANILARAILKTGDSQELPTPTPTDTREVPPATESATEAPVIEPTPSPTSTSTPTPSPTDAVPPTSTASPQPTATEDDDPPAPTEEGEPTATPNPTSSPDPTDTDEPDETETEEPDETDEPDEDETEEPTRTPKPDDD